MFLGRNIAKTPLLPTIVAATLLFVTGCGPGRPFEIEGLFGP
ncbi:MAG: hypothetical protein ACYSWO_01635 [Planctomycetota bacterium]